MMLVVVVLLLVAVAPPPALACNKRTIVIRGNRLGAACCDQAKQRDSGSNSTNLPPTWLTTLTPPTRGPYIIPVGDCICGTKVNLNASEELNRPWAVHITIRKESGESEECSGSLLNRRWVVSAAHCFCSKIKDLRCGMNDRGFYKEVTRDRLPEGVLSLRFGTTAAAKTLPPVKKVERLLIHPEYWQEGTAGASHDLALIKADQDIYSYDGTILDGQTVVQPICLPPPGPVDFDLVQGVTKPSDLIKDNSAVNSRAISIRQNYKDPFSDMDCTIAFEDGHGVPRDTRVNVGTLNCHVAEFTEPNLINIAGRRSYLTAFGSTSKVNKKMCRANSYSPDRSIFRECSGPCNKAQPNPSLQQTVCTDLVNQGNLSLLTNESQIVRYVVKSSGPDVYCYPFLKPADVEVHGTRSGWCQVKCEPNENCQPELSWGWCTEGCDDEVPREFSKNIHEIPVDAFIYENCSINVDTLSEFCTGSPITQGKQVNLKFHEGRFEVMDIEERKWHPGDIGWNGNRTIIREGARYHGRQHTSAVGDSCFGDAGGSVWKMWKFRDPGSASSDRPEIGKLAVLTGVVSRFEENCGAFQRSGSGRDHPNLPTQHTVHSRVQQNLGWLVKHVFSEPSCGVTLDSATQSTPPVVTTSAASRRNASTGPFAATSQPSMPTASLSSTTQRPGPFPTASQPSTPTARPLSTVSMPSTSTGGPFPTAFPSSTLTTGPFPTASQSSTPTAGPFPTASWPSSPKTEPTESPPSTSTAGPFPTASQPFSLASDPTERVTRRNNRKLAIEILEENNRQQAPEQKPTDNYDNL